MYGNCFASVGMDTSIKIWNLRDPHIQNLITKSHDLLNNNNSNCNVNAPSSTFPTYTEQYPLFSTTNVHNDYVDRYKILK